MNWFKVKKFTCLGLCLWLTLLFIYHLGDIIEHFIESKYEFGFFFYLFFFIYLLIGCLLLLQLYSIYWKRFFLFFASSVVFHTFWIIYVLVELIVVGGLPEDEIYFEIIPQGLLLICGLLFGHDLWVIRIKKREVNRVEAKRAKRESVKEASKSVTLNMGTSNLP